MHRRIKQHLFLHQRRRKQRSCVLKCNKRQNPRTSTDQKDDSKSTWYLHLYLYKVVRTCTSTLFSGQYKSLLTCRTCKYESARFEPFSFLQVPLPEDDNLTVTLIYYPINDQSCSVQYCIRVRNDGRLRDVLVALAKVLHHDELEEQKKNNTNTTTISNKNTSSPTEDVDDTNLTPSNSNNPQSDDGSDEASETSNKEDPVHVQRAQNLAVVDMKDGYISKIAPVRVRSM